MLCGGYRLEPRKSRRVAYIDDCSDETRRANYNATIADNNYNIVIALRDEASKSAEQLRQAQTKEEQTKICLSTYTNYPTHLQACLLTVLNGKPAADAYCSAAAKGKNPNAACKAVADNAARQLVDQLAKQKLLIK